MTARCVEQVERAVGVDGEVGLGIRGGPIVRRLCGSVDHDLERASDLAEDAFDRPLVPDIDLYRPERVPKRAGETLRGLSGRSVGTKEPGPHVVLEADDVVASLDETLN